MNGDNRILVPFPICGKKKSLLTKMKPFTGKNDGQYREGEFFPVHKIDSAAVESQVKPSRASDHTCKFISLETA